LLSKLIDIKLTYLENATAFKLDFVFNENDFFQNEVISKTYFLENVKGAQFQNLLFDRTEVTEIQWKSGKNLCQKEVTKTQRHKASGVMRTVSKTVESESFFHFFDETRSPAEDEDLEEEALAAIEEEIHIDLELGNLFKLSIIPRAYEWFTGKALTYEDMGGSDIGSCDDFSFDGEMSDSGEDEERSTDTDKGREIASDNPQCKQQ
jgi:nucleosome assembly protein 1-like 1